MEVSLYVTLVLGIAIIYLMRWLAKLNRDYWESKGVTYVESPPIIGIFKDFLLMKKGLGDITREIYCKHDGKKFVGYFQFNTPVIMIRDPEIVNKVLIKDFTHFEDRGPPFENPRDLFTRSFGNLCGDKWRDVRQKLTQSFSSGKMKMMFEPTKECSDRLVVYLQDKTNQDLEARALTQRFVLNVIGNVAFGLNIDTLDQKEQKSTEFFKFSVIFFKPSFTLLIKFLISLSAPKIFNMLKLTLTDQSVEKFFSKLTKDIIKYRKETDTRRNDFLQTMLDLKHNEKAVLYHAEDDICVTSAQIETNDPEDNECIHAIKSTSSRKEIADLFTEEFIAAQVFIFISGGSETVAAVLSFVLYELAQNQSLQKKVQDEINNVVTKFGFNYESVKKLTYMEQFIYETFRVHPIGPALIRLCTKDYKIPGTDIVIEKGNLINIPIASLQKDPLYFPEPEKFDPNHFADMDAVPKGVFFPFGGGPRICIAMRLAMMEMKTVLAALLSSYDVILSEKTNIPLKLMKTTFLVNVEGGVWVKFNKREV